VKPPLTRERLAEIRARRAATTEGPWTVMVGVGGLFPEPVGAVVAKGRHILRAVNDCREEDLEFVAHAREDADDLCDEVDRLRAELDALRARNVVAESAGVFARFAVQGERDADAVQFAATAAERDALRAERDRLQILHGMYEPWPTRDVLAKLAEAARILFRLHNYDGHGWEQINAATLAADRIVARLNADAAAVADHTGKRGGA